MDFFSQQQKAKRYTRLLLIYFLIAVSLIVIAVNVVVYYFFIFLELYPYTPQDWFSGQLVYFISAGTFLLIAGGSLYRWQQLKRGGSAVAKMVGAEKLNMSTSNAKERQLINVVEEMSIASGVPMPVIYIMQQEQGINAFVAGYQPTEAVMVFTRGAIDQLDRAELQGVVAHEYSHILNGDMQINVKLMAVLAGILMISVAGHTLLRGSRGSTSGRSGSALIILGILFLLLGYTGVFLGRIIKAAVSRQREFLADAAAVQFTRYPRGIASALDKIRQSSYQSVLQNAHAEDMSHMCFSQALTQRFTSWLATHPPLDIRISRIDPGYLGLAKARELSSAINERKSQAAQPVAGFSGAVDESISGFAPVGGAQLSETVGQIDQPHIAYASSVHASYSSQLMNAAHNTQSAKLIVYAFILERMNKSDGINILTEFYQQPDMELLDKLTEDVRSMDASNRLPLFDLLIPSLKSMTADEAEVFIERCERLIKSDKRFTLNEFLILTLLQKHLSPDSGMDVKIKYHSYRQVAEPVQLIMSLMLHASGSTSGKAEEIISQYAPGFSMQPFQLKKRSQMTPAKIKKSLSELTQLSPLLKRGIIECCADIALEDREVKPIEVELVRAIAESLDCPVPLLLPQNTPGTLLR